jgi:hypothetical protein
MRCCSRAVLVALEVEAVDGVVSVQPLETKAALDGTAVARLPFQARQGFQGLREAEVLGGVRENEIIAFGQQERAGDEIVQLGVFES